MRAAAVGTLTLAASVLAASLLVACKPAEPSATACALGSAPPGVTTATSGGLTVTEKGFTQLGSSHAVISLGAVIENTSGQVAYRSRITFGYADSSGRDARVTDAAGLIVEVPLIRPGEKVPVGTFSYVRQGTSGARVDVSQIQVTADATQWAAVSDSLPSVSAQPTSLQRSTVDASAATVDYTATVSSCRTLSPRGVTMVFRDDAGKIVGGGMDLNSREQCVPGSSSGQAVISRSLPTSAVAAQLLPLCDLAPRPAASGPVN